jgi:proteasome lid subunit RPN8/RPN11
MLMHRADRVVLGDVHEAPMPRVRPDDLRQALSLCECRGVARTGELAVKVSGRAMHAMEKAAAAVSPLSCAGALLGTVYQVGENWLIDVQEALAFNATPEMHRVRVPRHAWQEMLAQRKATFPEMRVVGWYHSHPGLGAGFSDGDSFVQRFFFPADWQVACVLDPDRRDVQFFSRRGRNVAPLGAYWVERDHTESASFEPPASPSPERGAHPPQKSGGTPEVPQQPELLEAQQSTETYLKERFVERSLEKILRLLKEPPLTLRDFVMMGMMGLLVIVLIFTRMSSSSSTRELTEIAERLDRISQRLDAIQASPAARPAPPGKSAAAPPAVAVHPSGKAPADGAADVDHVMQPGETLWNVADQYYMDRTLSDPLMRYNKIGDARDLRAGTTIKIPSASKLQKMGPGPADADQKARMPVPTPH